MYELTLFLNTNIHIRYIIQLPSMWHRLRATTTTTLTTSVRNPWGPNGLFHPKPHTLTTQQLWIISYTCAKRLIVETH